MKLIESSPLRGPTGEITLESRIRGTLAHGLQWYSEMNAQEYATERLGRVLGREYVLIRNAELPAMQAPLPMVLIGPQGVFCIIASPLKGSFRAKAEDWKTLSGGSLLGPGPQMQALALSLSDRLLRFFQSNGVPLPEVEPVLLFTDPHTHVDTARPVVRIVLADGISHFASNLQRMQPIMDEEDIEHLSGLLVHPPQAALLPGPATPLPEAPPTGPKSRPIPPPIDDDPFRFETAPGLHRQRRIMGMTFGQWVVIGVMLVLEIVVVVTFASFVLSTTP